MKRTNLFSLVAILLILVLLITSCTTGSQNTTTQSTKTAQSQTTTSTQATTSTSSAANSEWWDKFGTPQYGGTLTFAIDAFPSSWDPYNWMNLGSVCFDQLLCPDWTLEDRSIVLNAFIPDQYWTGFLAESWEFSDLDTLILHIREGVYWQDKAPVNGREFTSDDVVYHFDRMMGTGNGFTTPNPSFAPMVKALDKVTAVDKYTVAFEFKSPTPPMNFLTMVDTNLQYMEAREWVEQGDTNNWENNVGTGAWMLEDVTQGVSLTAVKNPDYWGYDERYPENRLPYVDSVKKLLITDASTKLAALRTGKIDAIWSLNWQQKGTLLDSNPEIQYTEAYSTPFVVLARNDAEPFSDLRVRMAMDMAIDREAIASDYYSGSADPTPYGAIMQRFDGYCYKYSEWSQSLKDEYAYDPDGAKQLLAEAGYPNGFTTNCVTPASMDLQLLQVIKSYFTDIGIDMEITSMDPVSANAFVAAKKQDQLDYWMLFPRPFQSLDNYASFGQNRSNHHDADYDQLVKNFINATDLDDMKKWSVEADKYSIEQHLLGNRLPIYKYFHVWQPYLKGMSGEGLVGIPETYYWSRWWIDESLKK